MDKEQTAIARLREASSMSLKVYKQPLVVFGIDSLNAMTAPQALAGTPTTGRNSRCFCSRLNLFKRKETSISYET